MVVDRIEEGPSQQEVGTEDVLLGADPILALTDQADVQQLAGIVPLVCGVSEVDAFVALQPDQARAETRCKRPSRLSLPDAGLALEKEWLVDPHRNQDRCRESPVTQVVLRSEQLDDRVHRRWVRGVGRCVHRVSVTSPRTTRQAIEALP